MKASLIMPVYNKLPRLKLVIASIIGQKAKKDVFEVIFVDDGSTDGSKEYFESVELPFSYQYIRIENSGRSIARNTAIREAKNEILIFVDDDVILHPSFIEEHLREQEQEQKVVHGRILNLSDLKFFEDPSKGIFYPALGKSGQSESLRKRCITEEDVLYHFTEKLEGYKRITSFEKIVEQILSYGCTRADWISFSGGNTSVPRLWLEEIGLFDEEMGKVWGCEDLEVGYRLFQRGKKFTYSHTAKNYHIAHYRANFKEEHNTSLSYFYQKHKDSIILRFQDYVDGKIKSGEFINDVLTTDGEVN